MGVQYDPLGSLPVTAPKLVEYDNKVALVCSPPSKIVAALLKMQLSPQDLLVCLVHGLGEQQQKRKVF